MKNYVTVVSIVYFGSFLIFLIALAIGGKIKSLMNRILIDEKMSL